jgi:hypothetical protein
MCLYASPGAREIFGVSLQWTLRRNQVLSGMRRTVRPGWSTAHQWE